jgi:hypothetical protein
MKTSTTHTCTRPQIVDPDVEGCDVKKCDGTWVLVTNDPGVSATVGYCPFCGERLP